MIETVRNAVVAAAAAASLVACAPAQPTATQSTAEPIPASQTVRNIVLVHGAFADGSGWRSVYDDLTSRGYHVSVVQTRSRRLRTTWPQRAASWRAWTALPSLSATPMAAR